MIYKWPKVATLAYNTCSLYTFSSLMYSFLPRDNFLKKIFDFTDDRDCVAAVERLSVLHHSLDFILLSSGFIESIVEH